MKKNSKKKLDFQEALIPCGQSLKKQVWLTNAAIRKSVKFPQEKYKCAVGDFFGPPVRATAATLTTSAN